MSKIPVGLQLYSVREDCAKDPSGVIAQVAKMGYAGVEFAGYHGRSAAELRKILDDNGLKCCGTHTGIQTVQDDQLQATIEFALTLGNPYLIVPGLPEPWRNSRDAWLRTAEFFNALSEKIAPHNLLCGYHNHHIEFTAMDGELPWDTFFGNTNCDVVMQLDTGNAMHGGADPIPFLSKYPGRALTVHLKEFSATNPKALIGEGDMKWADFFAVCDKQGGTEWYIVEQESYAYPPMECVAKCLENLKKLGRA
ncbi:MAG: sugar phosphate isomerase/epimerase [Planctomycetes bacterium]|nr:sugar phosphate isomerase/epimerase [Planctomycetota bacterium]